MTTANLSIGDAGILALLGYGVVFLGLISLMVVVIIMGKIFSLKKGEKKAKEAPAAAPVAAPAPAAAPAPVAAPAAAPVAGEAVKAPMPGNILKVNVAAGQSVTAGQVLCVLEAMKMENEIMAPRAGSVAQVLVQKGATVNTDDVLVVLA